MYGLLQRGKEQVFAKTLDGGLIHQTTIHYPLDSYQGNQIHCIVVSTRYRDLSHGD